MAVSDAVQVSRRSRGIRRIVGRGVFHDPGGGIPRGQDEGDQEGDGKPLLGYELHRSPFAWTSSSAKSPSLPTLTTLSLDNLKPVMLTGAKVLLGARSQLSRKLSSILDAG